MLNLHSSFLSLPRECTRHAVSHQYPRLTATLNPDMVFPARVKTVLPFDFGISARLLPSKKAIFWSLSAMISSLWYKVHG